jgi:hypothetical protein
VFDSLVNWQAAHKVSDAELARRCGIAHTTISRAKATGRCDIKIKLQIEQETGGAVRPEDWARFEAERAKSQRDSVACDGVSSGET